jgi:hypothetical protein
MTSVIHEVEEIVEESTCIYYVVLVYGRVDPLPR